jgi:archaellum component FlaF (FlaF/FlaG flagellin family)
MGFGTIIAGIFFVVVLIASCYVYADSVTRLSQSSLESIQGATSIQLEKLRSSADIVSIVPSPDRTMVYVNITNTGELKITRNEFQYIDILITYTDDATGVTQTYWCYFVSSPVLYAPTQVRWLWWLNSTNPVPAIINPLDWDPSKTLSITIELAYSQQIRSGTNGYLRVTLPEGSSCAQTFQV